MKLPGIKKIGKEKLLLLAAVGIILIFFSYFDIERGKTNKKSDYIPVKTETDYVEEMEKKITNLLNSIEGISGVQTVITLKEGSEKVVKEDIESNSSQREEGSIIDNENSVKKTTVIFSGEEDSPYVIKEIYPRVQGIAITAKGISDIQKKNSIISMLSALFDVPIHKITVINI